MLTWFLVLYGDLSVNKRNNTWEGGKYIREDDEWIIIILAVLSDCLESERDSVWHHSHSGQSCIISYTVERCLAASFKGSLFKGHLWTLDCQKGMYRKVNWLTNWVIRKVPVRRKNSQKGTNQKGEWSDDSLKGRVMRIASFQGKV